MNHPTASVVVCTRDRAAVLDRCLTGIAELDHPSFEVVVVDNSPGDAATAQLADRFGATYVLEPMQGLSRARNTGARAARGDVLAFTDDDAVPDRAWLRAHAEALGDPTLSATTGRIVPLDRPGGAALAYSAIGGEDLGGEGLRVDRQSEHWFELTNFGGIGVGPNLALRRALFRGGWGFREDLGMGHRILGEEHYAFFELVRAGHAIAYVPNAVVRHQSPASIEAVELRQRRILRSSSAYMFMLLVEERDYSRQTLKYAARALGGQRRPWRREVSATFGSRRARLAAGLAGPAIYLSHRLTSSRHERHRPPAQGGR